MCFSVCITLCLSLEVLFAFLVKTREKAYLLVVVYEEIIKPFEHFIKIERATPVIKYSMWEKNEKYQNNNKRTLVFQMDIYRSVTVDIP